MNPALLDNMSWEMAEVYGAITDQIIINMARLFPYVKVGGKVPESAFAYQSAMLAQMGQVNKQTIQIIRNGLSDADAALSGVLEATIADAIKKAEPELYKGAKKGMLSPPAVPVLSPNQTRAFQLYYRQAADKLNLVNTVMLESTQDAYRQCISDVVSEYALAEAMNRTQIALDVAAGETITGVSSWNQALRHATDRMKENGIYGFIDHAGRHWSAESYVAMDIRTTVYNTGRAAVWESNETFGNDLYIVSYHNGARPLCYDWQNKVISANNVSRDVVDLDGNPVHVYAQNETTYGQAAGLFGINCKHYPSPFVPGVSTIRGQVQDKEANDREYEESQKQRQLERNLREEKRDLEILKAQDAPEEMIKAQRARVRKASDEIDDFCDETGRVRRRNREGVYTKREFPEGYDPTQFPREQQKRFDDYWKNGGTQSSFTFGQLVPNIPLVPNPAPVPATPPVTQTPAQNVAPQATTTAAPVVQSELGEPTSYLVKDYLPKSGIEKVAPEAWTHAPTTDEIISLVGGGDRTYGSCQSAAFAYTGNRTGKVVRDFRGGQSTRTFCSDSTLKSVCEFPGVNGKFIFATNDLQTANELISQIEDGKEYVFAVAKHTAIIRKQNGVVEFLELQTRFDNGFKTLDKERLINRFGCRKRAGKDYYGAALIDTEKLVTSPDFNAMLDYINTAEGKELKGIGGGAK